MAFRIKFHPEANIEFSSAIGWYELNSEDLGMKLSFQVDATIRRIIERPDLFPPFVGELRKAAVLSFPYNVIYKVKDEIIFIQSVLHHKRSHKRILKRKF